MRTLEILFAQIPRKFAVDVTRIGDEALEERTRSREEMIDVALQR